MTVDPSQCLTSWSWKPEKNGLGHVEVHEYHFKGDHSYSRIQVFVSPSAGATCKEKNLLSEKANSFL